MKKILSVLLVLTLAVTAVPLTFAAASGGSNSVYIVADGVTYQVSEGDTFEYVYNFSFESNSGERLCSLDGEFFYGKSGLELIIPENEDELTIGMIFPRLKYSVMYNEIEPGHIKYNYSGAQGTKYDKDTYVLIRAQFKVTASEGIYEIRNAVHTVAGLNEKKYIYNDEVIEAPAINSSGGLTDKEPYDPDDPAPDPTDPPTDPPTEKPTSPATDPPTEAPTDPLTEKPTSPATDPPTEAPTDPPTENPTSPATDPSIPDERKYGDVDNDGDITIVDVSYIQRHLAGINTFDAVQLKYGDVDGDGNVTIVDGTYIQRWLAGILKDNPMTRFGYPRS